MEMRKQLKLNESKTAKALCMMHSDNSLTAVGIMGMLKEMYPNQGVAERFELNALEQRREGWLDNGRKTYLSGSFVYSDTIEGHRFWREIEDEINILGE